MNRTAAILATLAALIAPTAYAEDDFDLQPMFFSDGEQSAIGLSFTFRFGGTFPTAQEVADLWHGDTIQPESMVAAVGEAGEAVKAKPLPAGTDTRPWYKRLSGLDWSLILGGATLLGTELMGETDIFGRDDGGSSSGGGMPDNVSGVIVNQSGEGSIVINSPSDSSTSTETEAAP